MHISIGSCCQLLQSAGDVNGCAVDVACLGGGQEGNHLGNFLGLAETTKRAALQHLLLDLVGHHSHHGRVYVAGQDAVDPNAKLAELPGGHLGERHDARLGGGIIGLTHIAQARHNAGQIHNAAPTQLLLDHCPGKVLRHQKRALQIHTVHVVEVVLLHLQQVTVACDARRVDHNARCLLELLLRCGHSTLHTLGRRDIHLDGGATCTQLGCRLLGRLQIAIGCNHLGAITCQKATSGASDARAGTCK